MRRYASAWVIWPTIAATWLAFAQVVTFQALALFVIGGSVVTALAVVTLCRAGRRLLGFAALVTLTLGCAWLAEVLAGNTSGPVTRATLMACGITGAMALMLHTRYPVAILPASLVLLGGALGLGSAEQVPWLAGLWAVAAALTIAMLGPYRQVDLRDRRRLGPFALMLLVPGLVAVMVIVVLAPVMTDAWTIPGSGQVAVLPTPSPSAVSPTPSPSPSASSTSSSVAPSSSPTASVVPPTAAPAPPAEEVEAVSPSTLLSWLQIALVLLLLILVLLVLVLLAWRVWVALLWRWLRRRLDSGSPRQRAVGAWTWLRMRRLRHDVPLPISVSPDVAIGWARDAGEADVLAIAQVVAPVAFDEALAVTEKDAARAWAAALSGGRLPRGSLRQRWRWALRTPGWVRARMTQPGAVRESVGARSSTGG